LHSAQTGINDRDYVINVLAAWIIEGARGCREHVTHALHPLLTEMNSSRGLSGGGRGGTCSEAVMANLHLAMHGTPTKGVMEKLCALCLCVAGSVNVICSRSECNCGGTVDRESEELGTK
jgi:hypothetical protein